MTSSPTDAAPPVAPSARLEAIERAIAEACARAGRARASVTLVAVSKTHPDAAVAALAAQGVGAFGENKVQAFLARKAAFPALDWHLIGPVQTNKAKDLAKAPPALLHTIDRAALVEALWARLTAPLPCLVQVDIDAEATKSGVAVDALDALVDAVAAAPMLSFRGLMCIPRPLEDVGPDAVRRSFARLRGLLDGVRDRLAPGCAGELSMGMSDDFGLAIEEGATLVRIGTALFGPRPARPDAA
ncbi:MAG: YggS family pyridoxal phosphate-dependent enzyme [Myxococcota bacterium]